MLFLLSPAKSLDYERALPQGLAHTLPPFIEQSSELIEILRKLAPQDVGALMSISDKLAQLNVARYAAWQPEFTADNSRQALFAFNGDVYEGLDAYSLSAKEIAWAQEHILMLSGLYGALRPLDWMQPYRLEMGTRLSNAKGSNLYQFWGSRIAQLINERQANDKPSAVINLASQEYFKSVDLKHLKARVVECVFEDYKGGKYKIISFHAKHARGLMARYAIQHQLTQPEQLMAFDVAGYAYAPEVSNPNRLVFRRNAA
ncbi:peroxide stress protein YaaA [Comamonas sp. NoAH]|uniref:peroxide stress protein YaaA n=1 Tax=Comamonas halotolerans TaxID=3041496 RepID=UPI0024E08FA5|nr:peroxide stress protein YaaA [Comamonas sp. NoAH]